MFQFPSNGKADTKYHDTNSIVRLRNLVSIPFKRESRYKERRNSSNQAKLSEHVSIPFKRESRYKVRPRGKYCESSGGKFQFPSNGKADTKKEEIAAIKTAAESFNSLQTGKQIQRTLMSNTREIEPVLRFNSLQTGKQIQSAERCAICNKSGFVSIPFKRESRYKAYQGSKVLENGKQYVSIPFKRESRYKETRFCTQSGRGTGYPKPNANCSGHFF